MTDWRVMEAYADQNLTGPFYIEDATGGVLAEGLSREVAEEIATTHNQPVGPAVRVYYNSRLWSRLRLPVAPPLSPDEFDGLIVLTDPQLIAPDDVWACLNADERPGGRSFRSMCAGDVVEIGGQMHECLSLGWRVVDQTAATALRQRFGVKHVQPVA